MAETSKILTVSYGTFSCTLEGFDDSFSTMKAIAEYFRDLAADDRYFGAEPPTPDAEMLARIAEREIERRVEARLSDDGVVLRTGAALAAPEAMTVETPDGPAAPIGTPADETEEPAAEIEDSAAEEIGAEEPEEPVSDADDAMPYADEPPAGQSVADKLKRIRAVVGRTETFDDEDYTEDQEAPADMPADTADDEPFEMPEEAAQVAEDADWPEPVDTMDGIDRPDMDDAALDSTADETDGTDGEAAPLAAADPAETAGPERGDDAGARAPVRARVVRMKRADFDTAVAAGGFETTAPFEETSEQDDDARTSINAPEEDTPGFAGLAALDGAEEFDEVLGTDEDSGLSPEEEAALLDELAEVEDEMPRTAADDPGADKDVPAPRDERDETVSAVSALMAGHDEAADDPQDSVDDDDEPADDRSARIGAEQGSDLHEEPEDINIFGGLDEDLDDDEDIEDPGATSRFTEAPDADEADLSRILEKTDAHLNTPESKGRREALSHLKAAVAATEAARQLGEDRNDGDDEAAENAFRDDLDHAVRPRRAQVAEHRTERPKPAPLKLVASQRIDLEEEPAEAAPEPAAPVRPRRVQHTDAAPAEMAGGDDAFAAHAASVGASSLTDLLEAAAGHAVATGGGEVFSRPQVMRLVRRHIGEEFSREDGLRAFGTLLRQGRIEKVRNGRFRLAGEARPPQAAEG